MTKENRNTLLAGALIVAAIWVAVLADESAQKKNRTIISDDLVEISPETMSPDEMQAALAYMRESGFTCTTAAGTLVKCPDMDKDVTCIRARVGATSGSAIRIDCETRQPIPTDEESAFRALEAEAIPAD